MSLAGKIFAVICMLVAVFYAGITAALVSLQENYKQKLVDAEAKHALVVQEKDTAYADLDSKLQDLDGRHDLARKELARVNGENQNLRAEWAEAAAINKFALAVIDDQEEQIANLNARVDRYNDDLKDERGTVDKLKDDINDLKSKGQDLLANRDKLQDLLTVRERDLTNAMKEVDKLTGDLSFSNNILGRLKERRPDIYGALISEAPVQPKRVIRGKVTGVDKSLGLVIINIGGRHEVQKGYSFIVFRGDQYVGKIVVDEVFPDMAATHYDRPSMKQDVEVGDDVTTKLTIEL